MNNLLPTTIIHKIISFGKRVRNHHFFTRGLILASFLYTGVLFFVSIDEIKQIDWRGFSSVIVIVFFVVGVSIWLQALSWALIMKTDEFPLRYHLLIYFKTLLMKRLPGGVWHWVGRNQLYTEGIDGKKVGMKGNVIEWLGLLMSGLSLLAITYGVCYGFITALLLFVIYQILYVKWFKTNNSLKFSVTIFLIYTVCWYLGSFMIFLLITEGFHVNSFTIQQAVKTWTANGAISTLFFFLPSGIVVKEFTLVFLLDGVLTFNAVILLSLQLRILMLIVEILIGIISSLLLISNSKQLMAN
jgi:hypothetical protein